MDRDEFVVRLSADEALVLSEWLERVQMTELSRIVDDPAVWRPLHKIAGTLDKSLPWIFAPDYAEHLAAARTLTADDPDEPTDRE
ncbi:hypothetical protein [Actinomadura meridiana]